MCLEIKKKNINAKLSYNLLPLLIILKIVVDDFLFAFQMSIQVQLHMICPYTDELIRKVLNKNQDIFHVNDSSKTIQDKNVLYWLEYEEIDFDMIYRLAKQKQENKVLVNSFCIRKGLLRKANFAAFLQRYLAKVK